MSVSGATGFKAELAGMVEQIKEARSHISPPPTENHLARRLSTGGQGAANLRSMSLDPTMLPGGIGIQTKTTPAIDDDEAPSASQEWTPSCMYIWDGSLVHKATC